MCHIESDLEDLTPAKRKKEEYSSSDSETESVSSENSDTSESD